MSASVPRVALIVAAVIVVATIGVWASRAESSAVVGHSPSVLSRRSRLTMHFEYVMGIGTVSVYSIDQHNRLVQTINVPQVRDEPHGAVASTATAMLYISYGGQGGTSGNGSLLAFDLRHNRVAWSRQYSTGIDSMAISRDGRKLYMPAGENSGDGTWTIIDAASGDVTSGSIHAGAGAHNTIMSPDGKYVYLAGVDFPYLDVASTATNQVVRQIGPLNGPGVRPFTIDGRQNFAFTTARSFLGFQVSSIASGRVLYTVPIPGFTWDPATFHRTPDHGISLSPDGRELYLIDTPNGYVHVFNVSGLPTTAPADVADIKLVHPPPNDGWLQHSHDGRYVYVGRAGDIIDTRSRTVVAYRNPLKESATFLEIDWRNGRPVATTGRYGISDVRRS